MGSAWRGSLETRSLSGLLFPCDSKQWADSIANSSLSNGFGSARCLPSITGRTDLMEDYCLRLPIRLCLPRFKTAWLLHCLCDSCNTREGALQFQCVTIHIACQKIVYRLTSTWICHPYWHAEVQQNSQECHRHSLLIHLTVSSNRKVGTHYI